MANHVLNSIYLSFFKGKQFKELKVTRIPPHIYHPYHIYEVWFRDTYAGGKYCEFSHNIVIP